MLKKLIKSFLKFTPYQVINRDYRDPPHQIAETSEFEKEMCEISSKYSMTSLPRLWTLIQAIKEIHFRNLEGDIVECGVWKGGNLILSQLMIEKYKLNKKVYGYDTFSGMSQPCDMDVQRITGESAGDEWKKTNKANYNSWCYSGLEEVQTNIKNNVENYDNIRLVQGKVEETLKDGKNLPKTISLLRLDTDWYESTKMELQVLYPRLVKGGVLIIDDYGMWDGCRRAVDEYFKGSYVWLHYIDEACRLVIK